MRDTGGSSKDSVKPGRVSNEARLRFFGIGASEYRQFPRIARAVRAQGGKILDLFYAKIASTPETAGFFASKKSMDGAKAAQLSHWINLFGGGTGGIPESYFKQASHIGDVHSRVGLAPTWYIGGYATFLGEMIPRVFAASPLARLDGGRSAGMVTALVKLALLDMDLALSAYFETENERRAEVIGQLSRALSGFAEGDLTIALKGLPQNYAQIERDYEEMRRGVSKALALVSDAAQAIHAGSAEIRQTSDHIAKRTELEAASLAETVGAMGRLTQGLEQAALGAAQVDASVAAAQSDAREGGEVVREAVLAMADIQQSSQEISNIVNVIDGIAFQTNLLALNAGVEAARAGDSGKGFAVVANEVRALAQRSAEAANSIKTLISGSVSHVERGVGLVSRSGEAFERIVGKVSDIATLAATIAEGSRQQASNLTSLNGTVGEMDKMGQSNAATAEQAAAVSHTLAAQSANLAGLVRSFRLDVVEGDFAPSAPPRAAPVAACPESGGSGASAAPERRAAPRSYGSLALKAQSDDDWSEF